MTFEIRHTKGGEVDDSVRITADRVEECRTKAFEEMYKRGWKEEDCYSLEVL